MGKNIEGKNEEELSSNIDYFWKNMREDQDNNRNTINKF